MVKMSQFDGVGIALPPGPSFVGGTHLVIMENTLPRYEAKALELIARLTDPQVQRQLCEITGLLPGRAQMLQMEPFSTDPFFQISIIALQRGRSFPRLSLWGMIEERLVGIYADLWEKIMTNPDLPPEVITDMITRQLNALAQRLNPVLDQSSTGSIMPDQSSGRSRR
jgi:hypothetical protein